MLAPRASAPYLFRAISRYRSDTPDAIGALGDLAAWAANGPSADEETLAASLVPEVVDAAVDECIALDVSGRDGQTVLACYTDALLLDSQHPLANIYLGFLLGKAGQTDLALARLDTGLAADPEATQGYVFRAAVHAATGDFDAARADLDRFDTFDAPADQQAAAAQVRTAVDAGANPFG